MTSRSVRHAQWFEMSHLEKQSIVMNRFLWDKQAWELVAVCILSLTEMSADKCQGHNCPT